MLFRSALCLELAGDLRAARTLEATLAVFTHHYVQARHQLPVDPDAPARLLLRELGAQYAPM